MKKLLMFSMLAVASVAFGDNNNSFVTFGQAVDGKEQVGQDIKGFFDDKNNGGSFVTLGQAADDQGQVVIRSMIEARGPKSVDDLRRKKKRR